MSLRSPAVPCPGQIVDTRFLANSSSSSSRANQLSRWSLLQMKVCVVVNQIGGKKRLHEGEVNTFNASTYGRGLGRVCGQALKGRQIRRCGPQHGCHLFLAYGR